MGSEQLPVLCVQSLVWCTRAELTSTCLLRGEEAEVWGARGSRVRGLIDTASIIHRLAFTSRAEEHALDTRRAIAAALRNVSWPAANQSTYTVHTFCAQRGIIIVVISHGHGACLPVSFASRSCAGS